MLYAGRILGAFVFSALSSVGVAQAATYGVTMLDTLGKNAWVNAINNAGQMAGTAESLPAYDSYGIMYNPGGPNAVTWTPDGTLKQLGGYGTSAYGINNNGQVVGNASGNPSSPWFGRAVIWNNGTASVLGSNAEAVDVNDAGQVVGVGYVIYHSGYSATYATGWNGTSAQPSLNGNHTEATAINAYGVSVGTSQLAPNCLVNGVIICDQNSYFNQPTHAVMWSGGQVVDLGKLGGKNSAARDINNDGQIVGDAEFTDGFSHAVLWKDGVALDLGAGSASAINNRGQVVGFLNGHASLWENGVVTDLSSLVTLEAGWKLAGLSDINDQGWIVGSAFNETTAVFRPVLLTPSAVPEPAAVFMMSLGFVGLMFAGRRRSRM